MSQDSNLSEFTLDSSSSSEARAAASRTGGYDYQFLEEPSEDLTCTICLSVLRDPHLTSCCGHHFCEECIKPIKSQTKRCPLCQEKNFTSMLNKSLGRSLNELKVYCPKQSKGCEWTGELKNATAHLETDCKHMVVSCPYCNSRVLRKRLPDHETRCTQRPFACKGCGQVDAWQTITGSHRSKCPSWLVPCPNTCGSEIMRKNVNKHFKTCPLHSVPCEFEFAGCVNTIFRKDVATHASECVSHHLSLMAQAFKTELAKRDKEIDSLKKEVRDLKGQRSLNHPPTTVHMAEFDCYVTKERWFSEPFLTHPNGYKLCLCVYPDGTGKGAGTHLSVFAHIMQGANDTALTWPFKGTIHVYLQLDRFDKAHRRKLVFAGNAEASKRVTSGDMNKRGGGLPQYVALSELIWIKGGLTFAIDSVEF